LIRLAVKHSVVVLQREFGIHRHQAGGRRQPQNAVGAHAVPERVLEFETGGREHVPHQRFELHLTEGAAAAFVPE